MKKRFVLHILAACMLLTLLAPRGFATETDPPVESCGDGLSWSLDGSTLTVSGSGAMKLSVSLMQGCWNSMKYE